MNVFLITGCSGFVGRQFVEYLRQTTLPYQVYGVDLVIPPWIKEFPELNFTEGDLANFDFINHLLLKIKPKYILHLASFSSVAFSWKDPVTSFMNNTNIFLNLVENVRLNNIRTKILSIGSSEEYGLITTEELPVRETKIPQPLNPYAVARYSQELLSKVYCSGFNLDIILTRSFNHIGVGQNDNFVIPSITKQMISAIKLGKTKVELIVGDINIVRDFVDVEDVVRAYYDLFFTGITGSIYNICSGKGNSIKSIIEILSRKLKIAVDIRFDKSLIRPVDNMTMIGSNLKMQNEVNWKPYFSIDESLDKLIQYYLNLDEDTI